MIKRKEAAEFDVPFDPDDTGQCPTKKHGQLVGTGKQCLFPPCHLGDGETRMMGYRFEESSNEFANDVGVDVQCERREEKRSGNTLKEQSISMAVKYKIHSETIGRGFHPGGVHFTATMDAWYVEVARKDPSGRCEKEGTHPAAGAPQQRHLRGG